MTGKLKHSLFVLPQKTTERNIKGGNIWGTYIVPTYCLIDAKTTIPRRASVSLFHLLPYCHPIALEPAGNRQCLLNTRYSFKFQKLFFFCCFFFQTIGIKRKMCVPSEGEDIRKARLKAL